MIWEKSKLNSTGFSPYIDIIICLPPFYPRLSLVAILDGKYEDFWAALGVCCSSWVVASRGSTGRSWMLPMGNCEYHGVKKANTMVSRTDYSKTYVVFLQVVFFHRSHQSCSWSSK